MRSKLFVPASRPELFAKALGSAADAISFDLEDAVAIESKPAARIELRKLLQCLPVEREDTPQLIGQKTLIVRVNAVDTVHFAEDLQAAIWPALQIVNLPMVESADSVLRAVEMIQKLERERCITRSIGILANIESPRGLRMAAQIATSHPSIVGLQIGYGDLFAPLGIVSGEPSATQYVRTAVRMAAGEAGVDTYDGAFVSFRDQEGYRRDSIAARQLGFAGRSCIHPSQIAIANEVFMPDYAEVEHAVRVVDAARHHLGRGVGAFTVDGQLVDGPFITKAERLVVLARRLGMIH